MSTNYETSNFFIPSQTPLAGVVRVPGDKSITHRAILFGLLANGTTVVEDWLDAADCRSSLKVAQQLGAKVEEQGNRLVIQGTNGQLSEPDDVLDCGNSGTTTRMFLGALAAKVPFACVTGDSSLRKRPMRRVIDPLRNMGAKIDARSENYAPFSVTGQPLHGMEYVLPVASAQVKSALLIAGFLAASGTTTVIEAIPARDHTENMLEAFGVQLKRTSLSDGSQQTSVASGQSLQATTVQVPSDISSAAFVFGAAALVPDSKVTVQGVGLNATRAGILAVLRRMGSEVEVTNLRKVAGEELGDVTVTYRPLTGTVIEPHEVPSLIDELPLISILAARAEGVTEIRGAGELRVKETDRISAVVLGLRNIGVKVEELEDGLIVYGTDKIPGGTIDSYDDHRIAMSFAVAGLGSEYGVQIRNWDCVHISYPTFLETILQIGGHWETR